LYLIAIAHFLSLFLKAIATFHAGYYNYFDQLNATCAFKCVVNKYCLKQQQMLDDGG